MNNMVSEIYKGLDSVKLSDAYTKSIKWLFHAGRARLLLRTKLRNLSMPGGFKRYLILEHTWDNRVSIIFKTDQEATHELLADVMVGLNVILGHPIPLLDSFGTYSKGWTKYEGSYSVWGVLIEFDIRFDGLPPGCSIEEYQEMGRRLVCPKDA